LRRFIKSFKLISATIFLHHEKLVKALNLILFKAIHKLPPTPRQQQNARRFMEEKAFKREKLDVRKGGKEKGFNH
jgi:hypothetical protein